MKTTQEEILLAPSSLSYDWEECQACFYARAVHGERKPPLTMPSIFSKIDSRMKASLTGRELSELVPGAPKGVLGEGGSIKAAPWRAEPRHRPIVLRGYPDTLIHFEGDDGSDQVIVGDYKTVVPSAKTAARYKTQLESYAFALEHPAKGKPVKVAGLGLLCYSPDAFSVVAPSDDSPVTGRLDGSFVWIPVDYDEKRYLTFLGEVAAVLNGPAPAPTEGCLGCEVRRLRALEGDVQRSEITTTPQEPTVSFTVHGASATLDHVANLEDGISSVGEKFNSAYRFLKAECQDGYDQDLSVVEHWLARACKTLTMESEKRGLIKSGLKTTTGDVVECAGSTLEKLAGLVTSGRRARLVIDARSAQVLNIYIQHLEEISDDLIVTGASIHRLYDAKLRRHDLHPGVREVWLGLAREMATPNDSASSSCDALAGIV